MPSATAQLPTYECIEIGTPLRTYVESSIIVVQESDRIHAYSTFLKRWFTVPVKNGAQFFAHDDHFVIVEGNDVTAWTTRFGTFHTLKLASNPNVLTAPNPTWVSVVVEGQNVHFFSAFTGTWATAAFAGTIQAGVDKVVGMATDGSKTVAYSAHHGNVVALPSSYAAVSTARAAGYGGYALSPGWIHFYSGMKNVWRSEMSRNGTVVAPTARASTIAVQDTGGYRFYSAFTDSVASVAVPSTATLDYGDHTSVVIDGATVHAWSSAQGSIQTRSFVSPTVFGRSSYYVLIADGADLDAFSGMRGSWSTLSGGAKGSLFNHSLASSAVVQMPGDVFCFYSAMRSSWIATPVLPGGQAYITYAGGVVTTASSMYGFASMSGAVAIEPRTPTGRVQQFGGNFVAECGSELVVFNPQLSEWKAFPHVGPLKTLKAHHGAVIADNGVNLYFYGTYDDQWSVLTLASPATGIDAADECGYFTSGSHVCGMSASGQTSNLATFPEFWRVLSRGGVCTWHVAGEPGALPILIAGVRGAKLTLPGLGILRVDPTLAVTGVLPPIPLVGSVKVDLPLPDDASLNGLELHAQALILRGQQAYLTNVYRSMVF
ncbi:MAG: hypothetical protein KDC95_10270 [Planctomycetes bacterium]|nr:hypothetical protein [Planctomycetota bacterium]